MEWQKWFQIINFILQITNLGFLIIPNIIKRRKSKKILQEISDKFSFDIHEFCEINNKNVSVHTTPLKIYFEAELMYKTKFQDYSGKFKIKTDLGNIIQISIYRGRDILYFRKIK